MSAGNKNGVASKDFMKRIAEGSGNVDESGNFSIEVLRSALLSRFDLTLANTLQESIRNAEITEFDGLICNKASHWFAIRKINGVFWNLNSTKERPEQISHFRLWAEMDALRNEGYSVFCVVEIGAIPGECKDEKDLKTRGAQEFWWKESDLISGTGDRGYSNPWGNVGSGMRLDGGSTSTSAGGGNSFNIEGLSEEEMIQMAMAVSMQADEPSSPQDKTGSVNLDDVKLTPEPSPGTDGAVRIQFRLPNGTRVARRFLKTESVKVLVAFVHDQCPGGESKALEMRAGFPPTDISPLYGETIDKAQLSGGSIQCRYS